MRSNLLKVQGADKPLRIFQKEILNLTTAFLLTYLLNVPFNAC